MRMFKLKILALVNYYLPGYKAGGPIRTLANMVERLGDEFQFKIVTLDRDFKDGAAYPGVTIDNWDRIGKAEVFYMSPTMQSLRGLKKILCSTRYDVLYLNSFFSPNFTIKPLLLRRLLLIPDKPLVIAPRGEFSPGALGLKRTKKRLYLLAAKTLGLYHGTVWQASSEQEEANIRRWFGKDVPVVVAPDLPPLLYERADLPLQREKIKGCLKIVFLSRISRMKNLDGALKLLNGLKGKVQFSIYGPMEDRVYWVECQKIINRLPGNIDVKYCGSVAHDQVGAVMMEHDIFFLPTLGENFGHVIFEALCAGCPVLISDQTPWQGLEEKGVGWNLPLDRPEMLRKALQRCVDMADEEYRKWSEKAREYGLQVTNDDGTVQINRRLFRDLGRR